jgi:hypothetical protein
MGAPTDPSSYGPKLRICAGPIDPSDLRVIRPECARSAINPRAELRAIAGVGSIDRSAEHHFR